MTFIFSSKCCLRLWGVEGGVGALGRGWVIWSSDGEMNRRNKSPLYEWKVICVTRKQLEAFVCAGVGGKFKISRQ